MHWPVAGGRLALTCRRWSYTLALICRRWSARTDLSQVVVCTRTDLSQVVGSYSPVAIHRLDLRVAEARVARDEDGVEVAEHGHAETEAPRVGIDGVGDEAEGGRVLRAPADQHTHTAKNVDTCTSNDDVIDHELNSAVG